MRAACGIVAGQARTGGFAGTCAFNPKQQCAAVLLGGSIKRDCPRRTKAPSLDGIASVTESVRLLDRVCQCRICSRSSSSSSSVYSIQYRIS